MKIAFLMAVALLLLPGMSRDSPRPLIDYHQHLLSPSAAALGSLPNTFTARDLIALLDAAGVQRALVLSLAYQYGNPNRPPVRDEYAKVRAENDWTARQVAQYPGRLQTIMQIGILCASRDLRQRIILQRIHPAKTPEGQRSLSRRRWSF